MLRPLSIISTLNILKRLTDESSSDPINAEFNTAAREGRHGSLHGKSYGLNWIPDIMTSFSTSCVSLGPVLSKHDMCSHAFNPAEKYDNIPPQSPIFLHLVHPFH